MPQQLARIGLLMCIAHSASEGTSDQQHQTGHKPLHEPIQSPAAVKHPVAPICDLVPIRSNNQPVEFWDRFFHCTETTHMLRNIH